MSQEDQNNRQDYYDEYEIDLREYIILLWNHKIFIGALVVLAVVSAFLVSNYILAPTYETNAKIQLSNFEGLYSKTDSAIQLLTSTGLMKPVMEDLGNNMSAAELRSYINNNLNLNQINNTSIISISVKNTDPNLTLKIAEGLIDKFRNNSQEYFAEKLENEREFIAELKTEIEAINKNLETNSEVLAESRENNNYETASLLIQENASLQNSRKELKLLIQQRESKLLNFYSLEVLDAPYLPENPVSPNTKLNAAIAAVLALMLGVFIVFFKEFMKED